MQTLKKIFDTCMVVLAGISVAIMIAYGYYALFVHDVTIGVNNINDQLGVDVEIKNTEDMTENELDEYNERWFMEVNYYSNNKGNGIELKEMKINYFSSYQMLSSEYRSVGLQVIGPYELGEYKAISNEAQRYAEECYFGKGYAPFASYSADDQVSYENYVSYANNDVNVMNLITSKTAVGATLDKNTHFTVKIGDKPYAIVLDKGYEYKTGMWLWEKTEWYQYSYIDLFDAVMDAVRTNSEGYGDYYVKLNFSNYFTAKAFDENGKYTTDDVTDIIDHYAVVKIHYYDQGATLAEQSMFKHIPGMKLVKEEGDYTYWQERMVYQFTNKNLAYRYSEKNGGYFVSIDVKTKKILQSLSSRCEVVINIDLSAEDKNIIGFDGDAFSGLTINEFNVTGASRKLYVLKDAFKDTTIKAQTLSPGITLEDLEVIK